jgi:hypothetical protein
MITARAIEVSFYTDLGSLNLYTKDRIPWVGDHAITRLLSSYYSTSADKSERNCHFPAPGRNCMTHRQVLRDIPDTSRVSLHIPVTAPFCFISERTVQHRIRLINTDVCIEIWIHNSSLRAAYVPLQRQCLDRQYLSTATSVITCPWWVLIVFQKELFWLSCFQLPERNLLQYLNAVPSDSRQNNSNWLHIVIYQAVWARNQFKL